MAPRTTKSQQVVDDYRLLAGRANANAGDPGAAELLEPAHVHLGVLGQIVEFPAATDVLSPPVQLFINGDSVVKLRLSQRHAVMANVVHLIADADRDLLPAGQHVELGQEDVG